MDILRKFINPHYIEVALYIMKLDEYSFKVPPSLTADRAPEGNEAPIILLRTSCSHKLYLKESNKLILHYYYYYALQSV
jgi:hypothetical protein